MNREQNNRIKKCGKTTNKERNTGIEPASQAWEAHALPMC